MSVDANPPLLRLPSSKNRLLDLLSLTMGFVVGAVEGDAVAAVNTALLELDNVREADFGFSTLMPPSLR